MLYRPAATAVARRCATARLGGRATARPVLPKVRVSARRWAQRSLGLSAAAVAAPAAAAAATAAAAAAVGVTGAVHAAGPSLIAASRAGNAGLVKRLLKQRGADVNDTEGQLWGNTPLKEAANYNHLQVVELLIAAGADLDKADRAGETPLMKAAQRGYVRIVEKLLKAGADFEAMDNNGQTALDWARAYEGSKGDGVRLTIIALEKWEKSHT